MKVAMRQIIKSALLAGLAVLALVPAIHLSRIPQWLSLTMSCPFWSATLVLSLYAAGIFIPSCKRAALFGLIGWLVIGGSAFIVGYVGPIILTPCENQGPLLGIFITGPIGSLAGTLVGVLSGIGKTLFVNWKSKAALLPLSKIE